MKKTICFLLAVTLLLSLASPTLAAATEAVGGSCGEAVTWCYQDGTLTISGTGTLDSGFPQQPWSAYTKHIERIVIRDGITGLDSRCFLEHTALRSVSLPDSLTSIGYQAFQGCDQLTQITIPKNVTTIGSDPGSVAATFSGDSLEAIYVAEGNPRFYSVDGVLFDRNTSALLCFPMGKSCASYTVPEGIVKIAYGALWFFEGSVTLPEGLQIIDDGAFYAADFTSILLPDSLVSIGQRSFANCDKLTGITIPAGVQSIDATAFASCEALQTITILNPDCALSDSAATLESTATIHGYLDSTAHDYAIRYGRNFVDVETGLLYAYDQGNAGYIALLPTETGGTGPAFSLVTFIDSTGAVTGYQPNIVVETDKSNATYQEMLAFVTELTEDCASDYDKAQVVSRWVNRNMTYVFGLMGTGTTADGVYNIWKNRRGNCMGYTQLTNFLLYLLDIPTATITSYSHCWSAALIDGRWIMIDSTNDIFDASPNSFETIQEIAFAVDDELVCVINDLTGVKLASYGISIYDHGAVSEITIPDYIVYIYSSVFFLEDCYETATTHLTIRGTTGSYVEAYIKDNLPHYNDWQYENGQFIVSVKKAWTEDDAIDLLKHVLFPDLYGVEEDMDFTGDGLVTEDDAIALLRHVLFPELYPLN